LHFEPAFDLAAGERLLQAFTQQRLKERQSSGRRK